MDFRTKPEKIMIYIEASEDSIIAAQYAVCLAKWFGARISAVYVVDIKTLQELTRAKIFVKLEEMDYEKALEDDGTHYLNHVRELAENKGVPVETILLKGDVFAEVAGRMKQDNIDLLVMGKLEEPESRRDFFYNTNERIFRRAPCPVIIVKDSENIKIMYDNL
ncbi:MAG: universal stress protein [Candidatus Auribacter fodinae]|jgi:nucleotide-binding universal stress UspA family protein|uniref:Universal stress protein n=1 Tax=Candidatus Auribacter fodinae TaxID=2093366 RepID=A0A3A4R5N1_9BACT|nr:MAG: universal stress protein [Candidatus Auribacter fodinae]